MSMNMRTLLVVDDDDLIHQSIQLIAPKNWRIVQAKSLGEVPSDGFYHAAFVDMHLTKDTRIAEGLKAIEIIRQNFPLAEIIGMSGDMTLHLMEGALSAGARRFMAKPLMADEVIANIDKAEALWHIRQSEDRCRKGSGKWIGTSAESHSVLVNIANLRGEKGPILIEGETGTGKEVAATLINWQENGRPMITVNVGAIPENLFESEFFGHVRGAFTGADSLKIGLAEAASGGDLFLDEIEALPQSQQAKLLRFLESGEIRRVGAKESMHVKVRVIAATNRPLSEMVKQGLFREDLLFRLSGRRITLPPLRDRLGDLEALAKFFLLEEGPAKNKRLMPEALEAMRAYNWPGNVRELKRICEQLALISPLPIIRREDVTALLQHNSDSSSVSFNLEQGLPVLVEGFERQILRRALARTEGDVDKAAAMLQISRSNFYKKIKDYSIEA